jgi:cytochrome b6-f complex iron-sulfur subunit
MSGCWVRYKSAGPGNISRRARTEVSSNMGAHGSGTARRWTESLKRIADVRAPLGRAYFDRRTFLDAVLAVGFVSTAAAMAYPVSRFLVPPANAEPATATAVAGKAAALKPNSGLLFRFGNKPGIVVRTADGDVRAFSAVCTHLDCTVQFKTDTSQLWCACHNGTYDLGGNVVSGPPPRALEKFIVNLRGEPGDEEIVVSHA